jgi:hypothetical protein
LIPTPDYPIYFLSEKDVLQSNKTAGSPKPHGGNTQGTRSPAAAAAEQKRASLVGNGAKWRITNLNEVARAIAKWA